MATTFPRVRRGAMGYHTQDVDAFLASARRAYDADRHPNAEVDALTIRRAAFAMQRGGYQTAAVDAALERLEDAFASRERDRVVRGSGEKAWFAATRGLATEITARLSRPNGAKFKRVGLFGLGYAPKEVDRFAERTREYFESGSDMGVDEVRGVAFRPKRHGYREAQVDLVIDGIVEVMLAVQ